MKKVSRKVLSILLVFVILVPSFSFIAQAFVPKSDEGMASFDLDDIIDGQKGKVDVGTDDDGDLSMVFSDLPKKSPITYNKDDAGYDAGKNLSYVGTLNGTNAGLYKVNDTSNVHIVESDVELQSDAEDYLDACLDNELLSDRELSGFLTASTRLANADDPLTLSSHEENKTSKMRIVNESNTASGDIVVLDDDAIAIFVQDTNEDAIEKATVTIRYKDSSGGSKTRSVVTNYLGAAIFDNMKGVCFGAVDIQHANYRSKTTLNVEFTAGEAIYKYLEPKQENELYVRCADLDGLDMTEFSGDISISDADLFKQDLTYTIIVSKTGNKALPDKINICAENAGQKRVVKTLTKTSGTYSDSDTATYICKANWVSNSFFKNGDEIYYDIEPSAMLKSGSVSSTKSGAKVADAKSKIPIWTNTKFSFLDGIASYTFSESIPGIGGSTVGFDAFKCPLSFGLLPDGTVFMSYGLSLVNKSKPEDMVSASWNPEKADQTKKFFEKAHDEFLSKITQFKGGKDLFVNSGNGLWTGADYSKSFKVDLIFSAMGRYNKDTNRVSVKFSIIVSVTGSFGMTWYVMVPIGPIAIPTYAGFNASAQGRANGSITLSIDIKSGDILDILKSTQFEISKEGEAGLAVDVIVSLSAYVGIGLHDLACVQFGGSVYMDFGLDFVSSAMKEFGMNSPRFKITGGYKVEVSATFLWFKFNKVLFSDRGWVYDSWGIYNTAKMMNDGSTQAKKIDLDNSQSKLTKIVSNGDEKIEQYRLSSALQAGNSETKLVDSKTLDACAPRYIMTDGYAALFRMMPVNGQVRLVYQLMGFDGNLSNVVNVVPLPDKNSTQINNEVVQYDVVAGENDEVAVALIASASDVDDVDEKAKTTYVVAERIDLSGVKAPESKVIYSGSRLTGPTAMYRSDKLVCGYKIVYPDDNNVFWVYGGYAGSSARRGYYSSNPDPYLYVQNMENSSDAALFFSTGPKNDVFEYDRVTDKNSTTGFSFNYKTITGQSWDGKSHVIQGYTTVGSRTYLIIGGRVFYIALDENPLFYSEYKLHPVKDANGKEVVLPTVSDAYDIQKGADGNICITALSADYDNEGNCTGSTLEAYRIVDALGSKPTIHGPQKIQMGQIEPSSFTAIPDSPTGACIAFYTKPLSEETTENGVTDSAQLYQWTQKYSKTANVESLIFTKNYVSGTDTTIPFMVKCKNTGTTHVDSLDITLFSDMTQKLSTKKYAVNLYPGDEVTLDLTNTPRPATWKTGVHKLSARTDLEGDNLCTATFGNSYLTMDVDNKFVNGGEKAFVSITNESMVSSGTPVIQIEGNFKKTSVDDENTDRVLKNIELGVRRMTDADEHETGSLQGIKYNALFDLDEIWNKANDSNDVLYGVTVKLVPKSVANGTVTGDEAEALCDNMPESVYIANPNLSKVVNINANSNALIMGSVIGNGTYNIGDTVELKATPAVGHKFLGWYSGDELVSKDMEIKFNATENLNYVAKFAPTVNAVQVDDVKMNYKQTTKLNTVVDADDGTLYTVTYTTSDPNIVSVDVDGNVTALKRGKTIVTCTITDIYGNQKQDTCLVTVKYSLWQWLIKTVLFGWIWY